MFELTPTRSRAPHRCHIYSSLSDQLWKTRHRVKSTFSKTFCCPTLMQLSSSDGGAYKLICKCVGATTRGPVRLVLSLAPPPLKLLWPPSKAMMPPNDGRGLINSPSSGRRPIDINRLASIARLVDVERKRDRKVVAVASATATWGRGQGGTTNQVKALSRSPTAIVSPSL